MRKMFEGTYSGSDSITFYRVDAETVAVVQVSFWEDIDSSAVSEYGKYNVMSGYVSLSADGSHVPGYRSEAIRSALRSCGWDLDAQGSVFCPWSGDIIAAANTPEWDACVAQAMWDYGSRDIACDTSGNNRRKLIREARGAL